MHRIRHYRGAVGESRAKMGDVVRADVGGEHEPVPLREDLGDIADPGADLPDPSCRRPQHRAADSPVQSRETLKPLERQ